MIPDNIRAIIRRLYQEFGSYRKVAHFAGVNDKTVRSIILDLRVKNKKKPGPKPKIGPQQEQRIAKVVKQITRRKEQVTARKVQQQCSLDSLAIRTVQRKISAMGCRRQADLRDVKKAKQSNRKRHKSSR